MVRTFGYCFLCGKCSVLESYKGKWVCEKCIDEEVKK